MQLLTIGINHHTAPVALRERVAFPLEQIKPALALLKEAWAGRRALNAPEAAILQEMRDTNIDLIVMGVDRIEGEGLNFGGVAAEVLREAEGSVLLVSNGETTK